MATMHGEAVATVWLVWDGLGGRRFDICETEADAKSVKKFEGNSSQIRIEEMRVMRFRIGEKE